MHLGITPNEWRKFIAIAHQVFEANKVPAAAHRELIEIIEGFESGCVLPPGKQAPPDPGTARAHPSTLGTAYHRLGGVYPIAHFADALVEKLIAPDAPVKVEFHELCAPDATRHARTKSMCSPSYFAIRREGLR